MVHQLDQNHKTNSQQETVEHFVRIQTRIMENSGERSKKTHQKRRNREIGESTPTCAASYSGERVRYGLSQSAHTPKRCQLARVSNIYNKHRN